MLKIFNMLTQNNTNTVMKTYAVLERKKTPSISIKLGICYHVWQNKWWRLPFLVTAMFYEARLSRKWLNICLLIGSTEWNPYFALLVSTYLFHLLNCLYTFLNFSYSYSLSQPTAGWRLTCQLGSTHYAMYS